jgi:hypothetical protein
MLTSCIPQKKVGADARTIFPSQSKMLMAVLKEKSIFGLLLGKFGDVVIKQRGKTVYFSRRPAAGYARTEKQRARSDKFRDAVAYAKKVIQDPDLTKQYETQMKGKRKSIYNVAIQAYMRGAAKDL